MRVREGECVPAEYFRKVLKYLSNGGPKAWIHHTQVELGVVRGVGTIGWYEGLKNVEVMPVCRWLVGSSERAKSM